jgi:hypothetical protein
LPENGVLDTDVELFEAGLLLLIRTAPRAAPLGALAASRQG